MELGDAKSYAGIPEAEFVVSEQFPIKYKTHVSCVPKIVAYEN